MKFRKITFEDHPILGNISLDFTDKEGKTVDNIIIAGENGCGKSILLNELFEFNPTTIFSDRVGKINTEIELSPLEIELVQENAYMLNVGMNLSNGIIRVEQDFSIKNTMNQCKVYFHSTDGNIQLSQGYILSNNNNCVFKPIFSDVEINFTPKKISNVTSLNIDEQITTPIRSNNNIATEITQLLIDIDDLDNSDLARWVYKNPGQIPPEEIKRTRMKRFTNAFHSIFPQKRFIGIDNSNGHKYVLFEEFGKKMPIEKLSSGEKQIVFRGGFLLKNQKSLEGAAVLIDEPEISLHPKWQLEIMSFLIVDTIFGTYFILLLIDEIKLVEERNSSCLKLNEYDSPSSVIIASLKPFFPNLHLVLLNFNKLAGTRLSICVINPLESLVTFNFDSFAITKFSISFTIRITLL